MKKLTKVKSFDEINISDYPLRSLYDEAISNNFERLIYLCLLIREKQNFSFSTDNDLSNFLFRYNYPESYIKKNLKPRANSLSARGYIIVVSKNHYCISTNLNILKRTIHDLEKARKTLLKDSYCKKMDEISNEYMEKQVDNITNIINEYQNEINKYK